MHEQWYGLLVLGSSDRRAALEWSRKLAPGGLAWIEERSEGEYVLRSRYFDKLTSMDDVAHVADKLLPILNGLMALLGVKEPLAVNGVIHRRPDGLYARRIYASATIIVMPKGDADREAEKLQAAIAKLMSDPNSSLAQAVAFFGEGEVRHLRHAVQRLRGYAPDRKLEKLEAPGFDAVEVKKMIAALDYHLHLGEKREDEEPPVPLHVAEKWLRRFIRALIEKDTPPSDEGRKAS